VQFHGTKLDAGLEITAGLNCKDISDILNHEKLKKKCCLLLHCWFGLSFLREKGQSRTDQEGDKCEPGCCEQTGYWRKALRSEFVAALNYCMRLAARKE
jgi:hypothetical protein